MTLSNQIIQWNRIHAFVICMAGLVMWFYELSWVLPLMAFLSFAYFIALHFDLLRSYQPFAGYANWVTSIRLLVVLSAGVILEHSTYPIFFICLLLIILADALDGYLARKFNTASSFGAYLDMETDAFYVCVLSYLLYQEGLAPVWILWVGWLRYLAVVVEILLGIHGQEAPPNPYARNIAGFLFVALLMPWISSSTVYYWPLLLAAVLVTFSFAYSFYLALWQKSV